MAQSILLIRRQTGTGTAGIRYPELSGRNFIVKATPVRIMLLDQFQFPAAAASLYLFLSFDCSRNVVVTFAPNEIVDLDFRSKSSGFGKFVL